MTSINPMGDFHNLTNQFAPKRGSSELNFRNDTPTRDSVTSIEIKEPGKSLVWFSADPEDNVAMALSILGVGRVTDDVEARAQRTAEMPQDWANEATLLDQAVCALRAITILREQAQAETTKEMDEAYALYSLAYPNTTITREEFPGQSMHAFWIQNLRKIRKDPTVLGAL